MEERFYGEKAGCRPQNDQYRQVNDPSGLYDLLLKCWSQDTCAPRMRHEWSPENPTRGQCSVTSFLVQDIFGGEVYGIPLGDGNVHCYNVVGDEKFDLTCAQFGTGRSRLDYDSPANMIQNRADHFEKKEEKRLRYELLKCKLAKVLEETGSIG